MKNSILTKSSVLFLLVAILSECHKEDVKVKDNVATEIVNLEEAFPGQAGEIKSAVFKGQTLEYEEIDGHAVFEGDIILPLDRLDQLGMRTNATGRGNLFSRWPNGLVFYTIDPSLVNTQRVSDAIAAWERDTPIRFRTRVSEANYITFENGSGCSSDAIGMMGGQQWVQLGSTCTTGNAIHEIGHCVGLWHEQSRADRDAYVTINWNNIIPEKQFNFKTYSERGFDGFDYLAMDFSSVMMYPAYSFSVNGQPTIVKKNGSTFSTQRNGLSAQDIGCVYAMYPQLFIVQDNSLYGVERYYGTKYKFGGNWSGTQSMAVSDGALYVIQGGTLYRVNSNTGAWAQLGMSGAWTGTNSMTAEGGFLFLINGDVFYKINSATGEAVLSKINWAGTSSITSLGEWLYTITNGTLYRVNPLDLKWTQIGNQNAWSNTLAMTSVGGYLYMIQDNQGNVGLYQTDGATGLGKRLSPTTGWAGSKDMSAQGGSLYIMQGNGLYKVSPADGSYTLVGAADSWAGTIHMSGLN